MQQPFGPSPAFDLQFAALPIGLFAPGLVEIVFEEFVLQLLWHIHTPRDRCSGGSGRFVAANVEGCARARPASGFGVAFEAHVWWTKELVLISTRKYTERDGKVQHAEQHRMHRQ